MLLAPPAKCDLIVCQAYSDTVELNNLRGDGLFEVVQGGLKVTAGGATISAGRLYADAGAEITAGLTVATGGLTVLDGGAYVCAAQFAVPVGADKVS